MSDENVVSMGPERGFAAMARRAAGKLSTLDERLSKIPSTWRIAVSALAVSIVVFALGLISYSVGRESARDDALQRYEASLAAAHAEQRRELTQKDRLYRDQIEALARAFEKNLEAERTKAHKRIAILRNQAAARAHEAEKTIKGLKADNAKYRDYFDKKPPPAVAGIIWPDDGLRGDQAPGSEPGAGAQKPAAVHGGPVADSTAAVSAQTR